MNEVIHLYQQRPLFIENEKVVLKAAQSVWATNKYFVLACNQSYYLKIREFLKPHNMELSAAYNLLKQVHEEFQLVPTGELPQITNALYHMAGYFKQLLSNDKRQLINRLIKENPQEALCQLEQYAFIYQVDYLKHSNIWPSQRGIPFNQIDISLTNHGVTYLPNELIWKGNHLIAQPENKP